MTILYHGSKSLFDKFDYSKMGLNGTAEGYGFYFTDNKEIASNYASNGFLYTVQFNGKKELSSTKKTITKAQLKKFIIELDSNEDNEFLSNFGDVEYEGYNKVVTYAINLVHDNNDSDVDLIAEICNVYGGKEPLQILYSMFGYDHIKVVAEWNHNLDIEQTLYIALVNDIIDIIEVKEM